VVGLIVADKEAPGYLTKRPDAVSLLLVASHLVFVLMPVFLAAWIGPSPNMILLWVWFGAGMHGLLNLMHEAAHGHVFRERSASYRFGHWFLAPLVVADLDAYRKRHWQHHRELGMPGDTKFTYRMDLAPSALIRFAFRCLFLIEALGKFKHLSNMDQVDSRRCPSAKESRDANPPPPPHPPPQTPRI
jgi:fatty acid desaturase